MELSQEDIQFIDHYLKKSEVVFDDLRMELVDHIAAAISYKMVSEQLNFYDAFKAYMIENKKAILKAGMVNRTVNFKLAGSKFLHFLMLKDVVIVTTIFFFIAVNSFQGFIIENLNSIQNTIISCLIIFVIVWAIVFYGILRKRFFILENNFILLTIGIQLFNLSRYWNVNAKVEFYSSLVVGILVILSIVFISKSAVEFYSKNKSLYAAKY